MKARPLLAPLVVGALGLALGSVELAIDAKHALVAYTAAFVTTLTIVLGALLFLMIAHTARARWFVVLTRLASAIAATMPAFVLLFVPIALGVRSLYPWAAPPEGLDEETRAWAAHAHLWLNVPFFLVRSIVYLAVWSAFALTLRRDSLAGDDRPSAALVRHQRTVSAAGLPVMALTLTFAAFDWVMSLNARWSSDIFGVYLFAGAFAGAMGTMAVVAWLAWRARVLPAEVGPAHFHALGRVLLTTVIFWAYTAFVQFLLIWITDMKRESSFYADRSHGAWAAVAGALAIAHFAVPFLLLLSRPLKRAPFVLALVGAWLVCAHALDVYWLVVPALHEGARWLDLGWLIGLFGVCSALGTALFFAARPVPIHDPALAASLRYHSP